MAYVDQDQSKEKTFAAVLTVIIVAALGWAFYTGLAFNVIKKAAAKLNVIDVQEPPPPPPKEPPPPPKETPKVETPPIVAPPPVVTPPPSPAPPIVTSPVPVPVPPMPRPAPPSPPAPPPAPSKAIGAKPRGAPGEWVGQDDYPPSAVRAEEQGSTGFKLDIGPDGKVTNCTITKSSGFPDLDQTACRLLPKRARFSPAKDAAGNGIADSYSNSIRWVLPKD